MFEELFHKMWFSFQRCCIWWTYNIVNYCDKLKHTFHFMCALFTSTPKYVLSLERPIVFLEGNHIWKKNAWWWWWWHVWNPCRTQCLAKLFQEINKNHYSTRCNIASHEKSWSVALLWWRSLLDKKNIFQHICLFKDCRYPFGIKVPSFSKGSFADSKKTVFLDRHCSCKKRKKCGKHVFVYKHCTLKV
jgi:hypothetical protein